LKSDPLENCHLNVKKLPKNLPFLIAKNCHFCHYNWQFFGKKSENFWQFKKKIRQIFGNLKKK